MIMDPQSLLDYTWQWRDSGRLETGETITTAVVTAPTGITLNPTPHATTHDGDTVTVWLTGGTVGELYDVVCHIVTSGGREDDWTARFRVLDQ